MARGKQIGRRTWLVRSASGVLAVWTALKLDGGRDGWGVLLGGPPRRADAQGEAPRTLRTEILLEFQPNPDAAPIQVPVAAYALVRGREAVIIDTLWEGNAPRLGEMLQTAGLGWDAVRHVIVTHYHPDHAGTVGDVVGLAPQARVYAGAADIPQIPLAREIRPVGDGDEVFGLRVVATPGHTAGHISVLDPPGSALFTGDAVVNLEGAPGFSPVSENDEQTIASVVKLGGLQYERVLFAHGPVIERGGAAAIAALAARAQHEGRIPARAEIPCCTPQG
jgi:glyoxylase-like metal-dependent hydrolase (beta-lactamase superfamily II)